MAGTPRRCRKKVQKASGFQVASQQEIVKSRAGRESLMAGPR
jgi:hypothetical protein